MQTVEIGATPGKMRVGVPPTRVYVSSEITVIDERKRDCLTPPHKVRSDDYDSYNNSVLIHLVYATEKETQARALLADLNLLKSEFSRPR